MKERGGERITKEMSFRNTGNGKEAASGIGQKGCEGEGRRKNEEGVNVAEGMS